MTQRVGIPTASQVAGDVFSSLKRLNNIISKNDGIRQFSILTNNCYDSDQGFDDSQQTHIRITNAMHDINQLGETYLRMTFEAECHMDNPPTSTHVGTGSTDKNFTDLDVRFFLGWKNSNECLKQLEVENMNIDTINSYDPEETSSPKTQYNDLYNCSVSRSNNDMIIITFRKT